MKRRNVLNKIAAANFVKIPQTNSISPFFFEN